MTSGLSVTDRAVRVEVADGRLLSLLRRHAEVCPMCCDEFHGTRGCPRFEGALETALLEMSEELTWEEGR